MTALFASAAHTCALLESGRVKCWGENNKGQLGYGNTIPVGLTNVPADVGLVNVSTTHKNVIQIACGLFGICAVLENGKVRCWGDGSSGVLGHGNKASIGVSNVPAAVGDVIVSTQNVTEICVGDAHACAVLSDGHVRC